jgi:hypothetical protein
MCAADKRADADDVDVLLDRRADDGLGRLLEPVKMTSIPASRSACATTVTPIVCVSRPSFASNTRIRRRRGVATGAVVQWRIHAATEW